MRILLRFPSQGVGKMAEVWLRKTHASKTGQMAGWVCADQPGWSIHNPADLKQPTAACDDEHDDYPCCIPSRSRGFATAEQAARSLLTLMVQAMTIDVVREGCIHAQADAMVVTEADIPSA